MAPSIVWKYFKVDKDNKTICKCILCNVSISRGGKTAKTFTTSNMMNHLKKFHLVEMGKNMDKLNRNKAEAGCSLATINYTEFSAETQATLEAIFAKKVMWDTNEHRSKDVHYLIGEMIAADLQPFSVVSDLGFQRLLKKIAPNYSIPSESYFSEYIVPDIFQRVQAKIQKSINNAKYISLTTGIWTATATNSPFLTITGHWLTDQFEQERAVLRMVPFEGSHTDAQISEELNNVIKNYKLTNNVFLVLQDSGANMVDGMRNCSLESLSCFLHTLQLSLSESIFAQQSVRNIITTSREIVKHFNHSNSAVNKLMELQNQLGLKKQKLIQDMSTRWYSTYYMLEKIIEQRKALITYAIDTNIPTLSSYQWSLAEKIFELLKPFQEIAMEASKKDAISSMIIPITQTMNLFLSKAKASNTFNGIRSTVEELQSSVEKRFSAYLENKSLCLSSLLDPRFKMKFQETEMVEKIMEWTLEDLKAADTLESAGDPNKDTSFSSGNDQLPGSEALTFSHLFEELAFGKREDEELQGSQRKEPKREQPGINFACNRELQDYLNLPLLPRHDDPFVWWKNSRETFPLLSKLALKYLSAPASSAESERVFSTGGNIYKPTRNKIYPKNGEVLMFLHYNLRVLKFNYSQ